MIAEIRELVARREAAAADDESAYRDIVAAVAAGGQLPIEEIERRCNATGRSLTKLLDDVAAYQREREIQRRQAAQRADGLRKKLRDVELAAAADREKIPAWVANDVALLKKATMEREIRRGTNEHTARDVADAAGREARPRLTEEYERRITFRLTSVRAELARAEGEVVA